MISFSIYFNTQTDLPWFVSIKQTLFEKDKYISNENYQQDNRWLDVIYLKYR